MGGRAGGGGGAPPTGGKSVSGGGGRSYLSHTAWWPGLAAVSVPQQPGSGATITKTKVNAPELAEEESGAQDAEPGGARCTAPSSGGLAPPNGPRALVAGGSAAGDCTRSRARRRGWGAPSAKRGARPPRLATSTAPRKRALANLAARMLLGALVRHSCRARQRACEQFAEVSGIPPPRSRSPGGHILQDRQCSVTRRARSAKLPHAESPAAQTEARAPQTPGARGWGAPQNPIPRLHPPPDAAPSLHLDLGLHSSSGTRFP